MTCPKCEALERQVKELTHDDDDWRQAQEMNEARTAERDAYKRLIDEHNQECRELCGLGDQEGVRCKYRPYFPRHCPECPRGWMIDAALKREKP